MSRLSISESGTARRTVLYSLAFVIVATLVFTYFGMHLAPVGEVSDRNWALCDFRDAVYYPCRSVRDGVNPYDVQSHMQHWNGTVGNIFPLYSPLTLLLYYPLAWLPFHVAGLVHETLQIGLLFLTAWLALRWCGVKTSADTVIGVATLVLLSQPGQTNVNFGQVTWPLVLGSYLAIALAQDRPIAAGLALALASYKPTYAIPVGFLLLCRGNVRAVAYGVLFAVLGALAGFALMATYGIDVLETVNLVLANQQSLQADAEVTPSTTSVRVDVPVFLAKVCGVPDNSLIMHLGTAAVLLVTGAIVWRETRSISQQNQSPASFASFVLILGATLGFYHIVYDLVFLTLPVVALFTLRHESWRHVPRWGILALRAIAVLLALNCLWTGPAIHVGNVVRHWLPDNVLPSESLCWEFAQTLNPLGLTIAWLLAVAMYLRKRTEPATDDTSESVAAQR